MRNGALSKSRAMTVSRRKTYDWKRRSARRNRSGVVPRLQLVVESSRWEDVDKSVRREKKKRERMCGARLPRDKDASLCHPVPSPRRSPGSRDRTRATATRSRTPRENAILNGATRRQFIFPRIIGRDGIKYFATVAKFPMTVTGEPFRLELTTWNIINHFWKFSTETEIESRNEEGQK